MSNDAATPKSLSDRFWTFLMSWTGRITAVVGLCATIGGGVTWLMTHQRQQQERATQLELAQTQAAQGDYEKSAETSAALLKTDPQDRTALDNQLNDAMLWAENFSVEVPEGQSATGPAGKALDEMMPILEAGLARSTGSRAADVQAHLGWAHWLNQHIAERESGPAAEQNFRAALATDPANAYANAMLGNWMLQNGGDFSEAVQHLRAGAAAVKARPFVRQLQIAGLVDGDSQAGARGELMKVANAMRIGGEPLSADDKRQVLYACCDVSATRHVELVESLSSVPPDNAWSTYLWLEDASSARSPDPLRGPIHDFIQANLLEISGKAPQALEQYRAAKQKLHAIPGTSLEGSVDAAIRRLTHS